MSSAIVPSWGGLSGLLTPTRSTGTSESAKWIGQKREEIRLHFLASHALGDAAEQALTELDQVRSEASKDGWNGFGSKPLNPFAYVYARAFLNALPTTAPLPEVSADPDGEVALDWVFGPRKALTVSIGATGRCTFAWMQGQSTNRGTDWIEDEIPASIAFALGRLTQELVGK
jgi:hypothetical protein